MTHRNRILTAALALVAVGCLAMAVCAEECVTDLRAGCAELVADTQGYVWIRPATGFPAASAEETGSYPYCNALDKALDPECHAFDPDTLAAVVVRIYYTSSYTWTWGDLWQANSPNPDSVDSTTCTRKVAVFNGRASGPNGYTVNKQLDLYLQGDAPRPAFYVGRVTGGSVFPSGTCTWLTTQPQPVLIGRVRTEGVNPIWHLMDVSNWPTPQSAPPGCNRECPVYDKAAVERGTWTQVRRLYR